MSCLLNRGDTSGSNYSQSIRRGRIIVDDRLLHRYAGEEMYLSSKHNLD